MAGEEGRPHPGAVSPPSQSGHLEDDAARQALRRSNWLRAKSINDNFESL